MSSQPRALDICKIDGVRVFELPLMKDSRGSLTFAQHNQTLPFLPQRYFIVFDVGEGETRGGHAHRIVEQLLICVKGSCRVLLDDGDTRDEVLLDRPELAIYIPPRVWATQEEFSRDAVLTVLASGLYDPAEYLKDYDEFVTVARAHRKA
jgi:UDP-2-acetamido-3-amino-2,3-dideoxy-glucuronate N-acetyltransferase